MRHAANLIVYYIICILIFVSCSEKNSKKTDYRSSDETINMDSPNINSSEVTVIADSELDIRDIQIVTNYLVSKSFDHSNDNMSIRFYPEGFFELRKDYEIALSGKWEIGERIYDSSRMIYLNSDMGKLNMMLSADGKLMDKGTLRIFE